MPSSSQIALLAAGAAHPHRLTSGAGMLLSSTAARCKTGVAATRPSVGSKTKPSSSRSRARGAPGDGGRARMARWKSGMTFSTA